MYQQSMLLAKTERKKREKYHNFSSENSIFYSFQNRIILYRRVFVMKHHFNRHGRVNPEVDK